MVLALRGARRRVGLQKSDRSSGFRDEARDASSRISAHSERDTAGATTSRQPLSAHPPARPLPAGFLVQNFRRRVHSADSAARVVELIEDGSRCPATSRGVNPSVYRSTIDGGAGRPCREHERLFKISSVSNVPCPCDQRPPRRRAPLRIAHEAVGTQSSMTRAEHPDNAWRPAKREGSSASSDDGAGRPAVSATSRAWVANHVLSRGSSRCEFHHSRRYPPVPW